MTLQLDPLKWLIPMFTPDFSIEETSELFSPKIWIPPCSLFQHADAKRWIMFTEKEDVTGHLNASRN